MASESPYNDAGHAEAYDEDRYGGGFGRYLHDREVEAFLSLMTEPYSGILDVGAGTGKLSLALMRRFRHVVSADVSLEMIRIARRKAATNGQVLRGVIGDVQAMCFKDQSVDCVVASRTLMHVADWKKAIAELCRVAERTVIIDFPSLRSMSGLESLFKRCGRLVGTGTRAYRAFLSGGIARELQRNSFQVVEVRRQFFLPIAVHRWMDRPGFSRGIESLCRMVGLARCLGSPVIVKATRRMPEAVPPSGAGCPGRTLASGTPLSERDAGQSG